MTCEQKKTVAKSATESYETVLALLDKNGFAIVRRRPVANLVQASKEMNGQSYLFNITCQMGAETKITMTCLNADGAGDAPQIIDAFMQDL